VSSLRRLRPTTLNGWVYVALLVIAIFLPTLMNITIGDAESGVWLDFFSSAGIFVLLAIGLNVVVGFAGLLDLGYAAFFAIGAYTYGLLASPVLGNSPVHHTVELPFWVLLLVALAVAALFGALLGAPTLRLRGDYLAIVTLGFGEIVPRVFRNLADFTGGVNGIAALRSPAVPGWLDGPWDGGAPLQAVHNLVFGFDPVPFYVVIVALIVISVIAVGNLQRSRIGRAWMAIREDEVAAAAMGVNTVRIKLLAFAIGASFSGFAGCFEAAKILNVSPDNFSFLVSVTILVMVVLGGMGNPAGVIIGAIAIYFIQLKLVPVILPNIVSTFTSSPTVNDAVHNLNFVIFGLILMGIMLLRPQGVLPSRLRQAELTEGTTDEAVFDARTT
jgi:ABC-type branched-subunit amino acid transport system permease subunit